jgi:competence protein ComGC
MSGNSLITIWDFLAKAKKFYYLKILLVLVLISILNIFILAILLHQKQSGWWSAIFPIVSFILIYNLYKNRCRKCSSWKTSIKDGLEKEKSILISTKYRYCKICFYREILSKKKLLYSQE